MFGPWASLNVLKSTPMQIPSARAAATKATPRGAASNGETPFGNLQAL